MSVLDIFSLKGRVALVTGGAGQFGRYIAAALAGAGAKTYIASRDFEKLEAVAKTLRDEGFDVSALQFDLGDERSIIDLKSRIIEMEGRIDILVNNANIKMMSGWQDDASKFSESIRINGTGLFTITRAFGNSMAERGQGSIINIGSVNGMFGPDRALYEGTDISGYIPDYYYHKAGMLNFTRFVASYYGPGNVRCNCISPSGLETENTPESFAKNYKEKTFLHKMIRATDLMGAVIFLASDASAFITGTNIPVDGGYTAK